MHILITGANRGLGLCLAREAVRRGHKALCCCRKPSQELEALQREAPERVFLYPMDVASTDSVQEAAKAIRSDFQVLDVIVNNAAVLLETKYFAGDPVTDLPLGDLEYALNVNVMGPIRVLHELMPLCYESGSPQILNITSEGARLKPQGFHYLGYSISKYALNMYTQKIRNYFAEKRGEKHIRIYMVHPGRMNTVMGVENAQIEPEIPAQGIMDIVEGKISVPEMEIPFIDYLGRPMPDHYDPQNP
jgi:NAD(P)-dependent dehydrogenase (short-subunit alcohol dehydrogenase family)